MRRNERVEFQVSAGKLRRQANRQKLLTARARGAVIMTKGLAKIFFTQ